jgi:hypothetical protein
MLKQYHRVTFKVFPWNPQTYLSAANLDEPGPVTARPAVELPVSSLKPLLDGLDVALPSCQIFQRQRQKNISHVVSYSLYQSIRNKHPDKCASKT